MLQDMEDEDDIDDEDVLLIGDGPSNRCGTDTDHEAVSIGKSINGMQISSISKPKLKKQIS